MQAKEWKKSPASNRIRYEQLHNLHEVSLRLMLSCFLTSEELARLLAFPLLLSLIYNTQLLASFGFWKREIQSFASKKHCSHSFIQQTFTEH